MCYVLVVVVVVVVCARDLSVGAVQVLQPLLIAVLVVTHYSGTELPLLLICTQSGAARPACSSAVCLTLCSVTLSFAGAGGLMLLGARARRGRLGEKLRPLRARVNLITGTQGGAR